MLEPEWEEPIVSHGNPGTGIEELVEPHGEDELPPPTYQKRPGEFAFHARSLVAAIAVNTLWHHLLSRGYPVSPASLLGDPAWLEELESEDEDEEFEIHKEVEPNKA